MMEIGKGFSLKTTACVLGALLTTIALGSCAFGSDLLGEVDEQVAAANGATTNQLTVGVDGDGTVTPSGSVKLAEKDALDIEAVPGSGRSFVRWEKVGGSGSVSFGNSTAAATDVSLRDGNATIQAVFTADTYQLTIVDDGNGSTNPAAGTYDVADGDAESISATADTGYVFTNWTITSGSATIDDPSSAVTTVTLTAGDATVRANFELETYTVTMTNSGNGSTSPDASLSVQYNVAENISASSDRYYSFDRWRQTGGAGTASFADANDRSTTIQVVDGDVSIEAVFTLTTYALAPRGSYTSSGSSELGDVSDIEVEGNLVYLSGQANNGRGTIMRFDVTNKLNPQSDSLTISTSSTGDITGIDVGSTYVYGADRLNGLYQFAKSDLTQTNSDTAYSPRDVVIHDAQSSYVLAVDGNLVLSYAPGRTPMEIKTGTLSSSGNNIAAYYEYAFITGGDDSGEFYSVDVSDPEPRNQGDLPTLDTETSAFSGGFGDQPGRLEIVYDEIAYMVTTSGRLASIWVDGPSALDAAGEQSLVNPANDLAFTGFLTDNKTYAKELLIVSSSGNNGRYRFLDVDNLGDPQVVGGSIASSVAEPQAIAVDGGYLYAFEDSTTGNENRFVIYEIIIDGP